MKSFLLKLNGREEGPYSDTQVAQMFADQRVNRSTPCKPVNGGDWKTVDDYLPTLKYGTQLPSPTASRSVALAPSASLRQDRVAVVDVDIPFSSVLKIMFKWAAAAFVVFCCFVPAIIVVLAIVMTLFASMISGAISALHPF